MANNNNASIKANLDGVDELVRALKDDYVLRVGIMGSKAQKAHDKDSGLTNAELGTFHEFGTKKMPQRSFIKDSLEFKLKMNDNPEMQKFQKVLWKQFFKKNAVKNFLHDLGAYCLDVIEQGFNTNGFGMWKPLTTKTEKRFTKARKRKIKKHGYQILTDTGRLRRSISFKVIKK